MTGETLLEILGEPIASPALRAAALEAQAEMVFAPPSTREYGVPPGTIFRETAYLQSRIVGARERSAAAHD